MCVSHNTDTYVPFPVINVFVDETVIDMTSVVHCKGVYKTTFNCASSLAL